MNEFVNLSNLDHIGEDIISFMSTNGIDCGDTLLKRTAIDYYLQHNGIVGFTPDIEYILNNGEEMNIIDTDIELENIKNCKDFNVLFETLIDIDKSISNAINNITQFEISNCMCFEEISETDDILSCLSLFFIEAETDSLSSKLIQKNTNISKIQKLYQQLNEEMFNSFESDDQGFLCFKVEDFSKLKVLLSNHLPKILELIQEFLESLENFQSQNIKIIDDSGILEQVSNGARIQKVLFSVGHKIYKISIRSESHEPQSFALLYEKTDEWLLLLEKKPPKIAYMTDYKRDVFESLILKLIDKAHTISKTETSC